MTSYIAEEDKAKLFVRVSRRTKLLLKKVSEIEFRGRMIKYNHIIDRLIRAYFKNRKEAREKRRQVLMKKYGSDWIDGENEPEL